MSLIDEISSLLPIFESKKVGRNRQLHRLSRPRLQLQIVYRFLNATQNQFGLGIHLMTGNYNFSYRLLFEFAIAIYTGFRPSQSCG